MMTLAALQMLDINMLNTLFWQSDWNLKYGQESGLWIFSFFIEQRKCIFKNSISKPLTEIVLVEQILYVSITVHILLFFDVPQWSFSILKDRTSCYIWNKNNLFMCNREKKQCIWKSKISFKYFSTPTPIFKTNCLQAILKNFLL